MNSVWGKEGGKVKKIWMMTAALGLGIWLTGCSPAFVPVEDPSESQTEERNSPETEKKIRGKIWPFSQFRKKNVGGSYRNWNRLMEIINFRIWIRKRQHPAAERSGMRMILSDGRRKMVTGMSWDFEKARRIRCKISAFTALMM